MEALQAVVKELYTSFILRDFIGNIVPGCFLLFSICVMFIDPIHLLKLLSGRISIILILILAGIAWITSLAFSSFVELSGLHNYYPSMDDIYRQIYRQKACVDQITYERFVVIAQASRNFFNTLLFSIPAWILFICRYTKTYDGRAYMYGGIIAKTRFTLILLFAISLMIGLWLLGTHYTSLTLISGPPGKCVGDKVY
jgi:hypothetical protein